MSWPRLALVATPDVGAAVLYEFNLSRNVKVAHQGFDLGAPEWLGEPGVSGGTYDYRSIRFTHWVDGGDTAAVTEMSTLGRLLMADFGWLLIQQQAAAVPTWLKLWRSSPSALSWDDIRVDSAVQGRYGITLSFTAESLLVGESITLANAVTVNNDPAAGTNPCHLVLGTVLGDAPAPAVITVNPSNSAEMPGHKWLLSLHAGDTQRVPIVIPIGTSDIFTAGVDTAAPTIASSYSGGSYRGVSFSTTPTLATRLTGTTASAFSPGRYKVLIRVARSDTSSTFALNFGQLDGTGMVFSDLAYMDRTASIAVEHATYVDLGDHQIPRDIRPDLVPGTALSTGVAIQAARLSGTGTLHLDTLVFIPLDFPDTKVARTLFGYFSRAGIDNGTGTGTWDGDAEEFFAIADGGTPRSAVCEVQGGFPEVAPGASNVLTVLQQANGQKPVYGEDASDLIAATTAVTVTYRPRWLWPRP